MGFLKRVYVYTLSRHGVELRNTSLFVAIKSVNLRNLAALPFLGTVTSEIEIGRNFPFQLYLCTKPYACCPSPVKVRST